MADRAGQVAEEFRHGRRIADVERLGTLRADVPRRFPEPLRIAAGEDDVSTL